jgi:hypothetical protein
MIAAQKVAAGEQANLPPPKTSAGQIQSPQRLSSSLNDRGTADLDDFEMILIALAAAAIFLLTRTLFETQVTLTDVDTTMLSGFGLGQGTYLIKKAALKAGEG